MRIAVYTDYSYRRTSRGVYGERAFVLFLDQLAQQVDELVLLGRLDPEAGAHDRLRYRVDEQVEFRALPHYDSLARPSGAMRACRGTSRSAREVMDRVDAVWLLGPHPFSLLFAALAALRGKTIVLGVRSNFVQYVRMRHPSRLTIQVAGWLLALSYRLLAWVIPIVVVGPDVAREYSHARSLLELSVSLVRKGDLSEPTEALARDYAGELRVLSVGRIDREKNPLLVADVMATLMRADPRWRLVMCGEGDLEPEFRSRIEELGIADRVVMIGYMPLHDGLLDIYRDAHVFLHVSWTEGIPQVLFEAFATGLPVVATAVGGVPGAVGNDAVLVPPGRTADTVSALERIVLDEDLRKRLVIGGLERVKERTLEAETGRLTEFLCEALARRTRHRRRSR